MDVHEGAEILARLGILESKEESPARKKYEPFVDVNFHDITDSDSDKEGAFDRNALVSSRSRRRGSRRSDAACCIFAESSVFAIVIICCAVFTSGFSLNAAPNVYNLVETPSFSIHVVVQISGMLSGVLIGRRLVGSISFTSLITIALIMGLGCSLAVAFSKDTPIIAILFIQALSTMLVQYCSISLILAFWRGHRRKLIMLFVFFALGSILAPNTAPSRPTSLVKREANNTSLPLTYVNAADHAHDLWDWSGAVTLRGGKEGATAAVLAAAVAAVPLLLLALAYGASCSCRVAVDGRVHRLREVEEFTPLSVGFRIRMATLQVLLGMMFSLCNWSRVEVGERREALAVQLLVLLVALSAGDIILSLAGLCALLSIAALIALLLLLSTMASVSHAMLFAASALALIYLPLLLDLRVVPRPLLTVDLLLAYPTLARLIVPFVLSTSIMSIDVLVFLLSIAALAMLMPMTRSLHKAERVSLSCGADDLERSDPTVLNHRPLTKDDYSTLINAIDDESEEESSM